jgi:hypothetical protein
MSLKQTLAGGTAVPAPPTNAATGTSPAPATQASAAGAPRKPAGKTKTKAPAGRQAAAAETEEETAEGEEPEEEAEAGEDESAAESETPEEETEGEGEDDEEETPMAEEDAQARAARGRERKRIAAILGSPEAKGRAGLAQHLAFDTDLPSSAAVATLKVSPKQSAGSGQLAARMSGERNPAVGPGGSLSPDAGAGEAGGAPDGVSADAAFILAAGAKLGLQSRKG